MKTRSLPLAVLAALLVATSRLQAAPVESEETLPVALGPGSVLWLEGKSSLHDYESRTSTLSLRFLRAPGSAPVQDEAGLEALIRASGIRTLDLDIPVRSLRSPKAGLDKNLWRTLRADEYPNIHFALTRYAVSDAPADSLPLRADGVLTVAGRAVPITLSTIARPSSEGLWVQGTQKLRMTDFGIRPPTMMLGTLRVDDRITVHYRLLLVPTRGTETAKVKD